MMSSGDSGLRGAEVSVREFLSRTQDLLNALNNEGVDATTALRERIATNIESVRPRFENWADSANDGAATADELIRENPWAALALGAVAGVAVGCVATTGAFNLWERNDFASKSKALLQRRYRPYAKRARRAIRDHWPF